MVNPNSASAAAVVVRRGKERVGGRKKRVSKLKKIILRERAAKQAAHDSAAAACAAAPAAQVGSGDAPDGAAAAVAEEAADDDEVVVLHVERGRVYLRVTAAPGAAGGVRLETLVVEEEAGSDSSSDESSDDEGSDSDADEAQQEGPDPADATDAELHAALRAEAAPFVPFAAQLAATAAANATVHACALCGISCIGDASHAQHLAGRRHRSREAAAAAPPPGAKGAAAGDGAPATAAAAHTYVGVDAVLRYGRQVITPEVNAATAALITRLLELQARTRAIDPLKAKARQRLVFGLREVAKAVRAKRARLLLVAPNVEAVAAPGGLDEALADLLACAAAAGVPVVLALTRSRMGALTGRRVRMSAAAVLDASGAEELFAELQRQGAAGRAAWLAAHPDAPREEAAVAAAEEFVRLRRDGRHRALRAGEAPGLPVRSADGA